MAFHLKVSITTIYDMTYEELLGWQAYFARRPVGWQEDDRTAKLLQVQGVKEKATDLFPSLKAVYGDMSATNAEGTNMNTLKGSSLFNFMSQSVGGDALNL